MKSESEVAQSCPTLIITHIKSQKVRAGRDLTDLVQDPIWGC